MLPVEPFYAHAGRDGLSCKRASTKTGNVKSVFVSGSSSEDNLPFVETASDHGLSTGDIVRISLPAQSYNDETKFALHGGMFKVAVANNTFFSISSNFSEMNGYQGRANLAPPNVDLQNYLSESTFERMLEPNILESISTRTALSGGFQAQVFTTRTAHNFVEGDLVQVSLHYQKSHDYSY